MIYISKWPSLRADHDLFYQKLFWRHFRPIFDQFLSVKNAIFKFYKKISGENFEKNGTRPDKLFEIFWKSKPYYLMASLLLSPSPDGPPSYGSSISGFLVFRFSHFRFPVFWNFQLFFHTKCVLTCFQCCVKILGISKK